MSRLLDYCQTRAEEIAAATGYSADFIFDQIMELCEDGQAFSDAIDEVEAIAEEGDY